MIKDEASVDSSVFEPITCVEDALIVPVVRDVRPFGRPTVVDRAGAPVFDASSFRTGVFDSTFFMPRERHATATRMSGAHLYGGIFFQHFGHFIFESIARLWAYDSLAARIEGIAMLPLRPNSAIGESHLEILQHLDVSHPITIVHTPTVLERLYVPRQGCGMGALASGTPAFRDFVHRKLQRIAPRTDAPKIYITRENYRLRRGGIFAEEVLSSHLEKEGYLAYSPELHGFEHQVATYQGAENIVGCDSSAMHLVGFAARPETQVAVVLRRQRGACDIEPHLAGFMGKAPLIIDAMTGMLRDKNQRNETWASFAELDFPALWLALHESGFIGGGTPWPALAHDTREEILARYVAKLNGSFSSIWARQEND
jgi:Glycosyltransferase 61